MMKIIMIVPTYWAREKKIEWQPGDAIYDHPTPLDEEGTLARMLESIKVLNNNDFHLVIIAAASSPDIEQQVEEKVRKILNGIALPVGVSYFTHSHLVKLHGILKEKEMEAYSDLFQLRGYPVIRNICLILASLHDADAAVLIDDDEYFHDPDFMEKAREFIGKENVNAIAGYYVAPDGDYILRRTIKPWMRAWNNVGAMNRAFEKVIGSSPRLKPTPFVFGGNMIVHKAMFEQIPFDPHVPRGEDIDYLMNAKMFGFEFYLDNELSIVHEAPPKSHPKWQQMREDINRFLFSRSKIRSQVEVKGMKKITAESLDPYPGEFLKDDLEEKVRNASLILGEQYLKEGDRLSHEECLKNIEIANRKPPPDADPFRDLIALQKKWSDLMHWLSRERNRSSLFQCVEIIGKEKEAS